MNYLSYPIGTKLFLGVLASVLVVFPYSDVEAANGDVMEEITVTGSHIRRKEQRDLASPLKAITSEEIAIQGAKDVADIIRNLTINTGSEYQVSGLFQPQTAGTSNINLRGLGLSSTLVLINGRRQTLHSIAKQDDGSSFVDTNSLVPKIMIERIDFLKDGAAATYGTDAVAGVANFITYKDFEGFKVEGDYLNDMTSGDYDEMTFSAMYGGASGNTNYVIAASYFDRSTLEAGDRNWPDGTALSSLGHPGAYLTSTGFQADPACGANGTFLRFGGTFCGMDITPFFDLMPEEERINVAGNVTHEFNDNMTGYVEFSYSKNDGETRATPSYPILRSFPVALATDPNNPFGEDVTFFGRVLGPEGPPTILGFEYETWRIAGQLDGEFSNGWSWEIAANHSNNSSDAGNGDTVISRLQAGLAGTGGPNGNQFYSPFGSATNPAGLVDFLLEDSVQQGEASLTTVELITSGELFEMSAGSVGAAVGFQYRDEDLEVDLDDILNADDFYTLPGGDDFSADRDVWAVFAELNVPLHETLELQLAARYEDYGSGVDTIDPKIAALWTPNEMVSVRGSFGTSFRAPSLLQSNGRIGANSVVNDSANGLNGLFRTVSTQGNPNLDPEEADVYNFGITLTPVEGFEASVDYWRFDYTDLIVKESAQGLVDQAIADFNNGLTGTEALTKVVRVGTTATAFGFITRINSDFINASSVETDGIDVNISYAWETNVGQFKVATDWSHFLNYDLRTSATSAEVEGAGSLNGANFARPVPEWRGNLSGNWAYNNHTAYVVARYIDSYLDDTAGGAKIGSHTTVDVRYTYTLNNLLGGDDSETTLSIGSINLFDRDPPPVATFIGFDVLTHDPRGRMVYVNLSHSF